MLDVTIVLPCAVDDGFDDCIASIDEDVEIVAVLNQPTPELRAKVGASRARQVEIPERNLGLACEVGCQAATSRVIVLMNTDSTFERGAIRAMLHDWRPGTIVCPRLIFRDTHRVVQQLQDYQQSGHAWSPGLMFGKELQERLGGRFYDPLPWTEDAAFDRRARLAGVELIQSESIVWHSRVSIRRKLRSAYRYGVGRARAEHLGLEAMGADFRLTPGVLWGDVPRLAQSHGLSTVLYHLVWMLRYAQGITAERKRARTPAAPEYREV